MKINRRDLLFASGLSLLAGTRASGRGAAPPRTQSQTSRSPSARLLEALQGNRLPLTMSGGPAGRGCDWLVKEARDARFTLVGEEHGVAETAQFSAALFNALRGSGYSRIAFEVSPIIAQDIEAAAMYSAASPGVICQRKRPTWHGHSPELRKRKTAPSNWSPLLGKLSRNRFRFLEPSCPQ
jgi:hypothetical protein